MYNIELFRGFLDSKQTYFDSIHHTPTEVSAPLRRAILKAFESLSSKEVFWYEDCIYRSFGRTLLTELMQVYPDRIPAGVLLNALAEYRDILGHFTGDPGPAVVQHCKPVGKPAGVDKIHKED